MRRSFRILAVSLLICGIASPAFAQRKPRNAATVAAPGPKQFKSNNFQLTTDLSAEKSEELLQRLETMLRLVSAYWGRRNTRPIEMYVIDDFSLWSESQLAALDADGVAMVRGGGGLTVTQVITDGTQFESKAVVYAGSQHGTPQHEAVHAYCGHAFGSLGPVWYAEGMAEVGNYWRENDKSVNADPIVLEYLKSESPRPLNDIVNNPLETTGDSWQNYAWRWALCHLLGFNENYTQRFKPLGLALLGNGKTDFGQVYGPQAEEIEFEYRQFLGDVCTGYRCDLCSWDWKTKFKKLTSKSTAQSIIRADRGWQASRVTVTAGETYQYAVTGTWKLSKEGDAVGGEGDAEGKGRLIAVTFDDYQLSEPFELGTSGTFTPEADGNLFIRCRDDWGSIADNNGRLTVKFKRGEATAAVTPAADAPAPE